MSIEITVKAAEKVKEAINTRVEEWLNKGVIGTEEKEFYLKNLGLKIGLLGGGCAGFTKYIDIKEKDPDDLVFTKEGVNIYVDPKSFAWLSTGGVKIDWYKKNLSEGLDFDVPNASGSCGCGQSIGF